MINIVKVKEDLTGKKFGRLTVIEQADDHISTSGKHSPMWKCICDCNKERFVYVISSSLKSGNTLSCGCLHNELAANYLSNKRRKYNIYEFTNEYGICYDENKENKWIFDKEDYEKILPYYWRSSNSKWGKYAVAKDLVNNTTVQMSRIIMDVPIGDKRQVDHINHDVSNNRKENLRICTNSENSMNKGLIKSNTSGVTGVTWNRRLNKWVSQIMINKKHIHLGVFCDFNDAVKAREDAEIKYFGEYRYKGDNNYECIS